MTDIARAARLVAEAPGGSDGPSGAALVKALKAGGILAARFTLAKLFEALVAIGRANLSAGRIFEGHVNAVKLLDLQGRACPDGLLGVWGADGPAPVRIEGDRLVGQKLFASGADTLDHALVTADLGGRPQLLLVDTHALRGRLHPDEWNVSGMKATASGRCDLNDLPMAEVERIGVPGDYLNEPHFQGGVWRYGAVQLGAMQALTAITAKQLETRGQEAAPLQAMRLRRMVTACETARLWLWQAAQAVERVDAAPEDAEAAILARLLVAEEAVALMTAMDQALGAASFAISHPAERIRRDLGFYIRQANPDGLALGSMARILADEGLRGRWIG
ncbi:acyl-CoA dehydrogenase family protein [Cereibacter sp. SYSU M97828]|nr:acyl-CoA dehydrogenase family protein [Cereibacter flavus]